MLFFLLSVVAKITSEAFAEAVTRSFEAIRCGRADHLLSTYSQEVNIERERLEVMFEKND